MADDARPDPLVQVPATPGPLRLSDAAYASLLEQGVLARLGQTELRGGELWLMNAQYAPHMEMKMAVYRALMQVVAGRGLKTGTEGTVAFPGYWPNPDVLVYDALVFRKAIPGGHVRLIVEVASSTLDDDLGDKRARYAAAGLAEYWVVDMVNGQVLRFHAPGAAGFAAAPPVPAGAPCASLTLPGVVVVTADWPWDPGADG